MNIDPIQVLKDSAKDARRTAVRSATLGDFTRAARFLRWAHRCDAAIAELGAAPHGGARSKRAAA